VPGICAFMGEGICQRENVLTLYSLSASVLFLASAAYGATTGFGHAAEQYQKAEYRAAIATLASLPAKNAADHALMGKAYYMDGEFRKATSCLEKAIAEDPQNSDYHDWLGKAYGRRAEEATFLTALPYARKTRESFEKAVALDPTNLEALGDLFEFYLQAPGIVGGGVEKAEGVAASIGRVNPAEYHYVRARLAEKRKDFRMAEEELRIAIRLAPDQIGRVIDLAKLLYRQGRYDESEGLFRSAARMAPDSPKLMFARASVYIDSGRNIEQAKALLRRYAELPITPDDPPRSETARLMTKAR
jgi:tetratricopeptide (TPR) repeat protein